MKDVAKEAGVSLGTVSKVVNQLPVGAEYRHKVEAAIKKLNYQVNSYAQGMRASSTHTVAFLIPNTTEPYFARLTSYISRSLSQRGYRMLLCLTEYDPDAEQGCIDMLRQNKVDGIIGLTYNPELHIEEDIPFVSIDRSFGPGIPCVASDNFAGGRLAAETLISCGCKRLAFLRIGSVLANEPNKRKAGFESVCQAHNLSYEALILEEGESLTKFQDFLLEHYTEKRLLFDGIFCVTDRIAVYVIRFLRSLGLRVPEDVQVIGFDGITYFEDEDYLCSTIVQPVPQLAQMCVELLLRPEEAATPSLVCLPVHFAYGKTTLPCSHSSHCR